MQKLNDDQNGSDFSSQKIREIAKILAEGIYRLEVKERSNNPLILLDNKSFRSLHSVDSNHYIRNKYYE